MTAAPSPSSPSSLDDATPFDAFLAWSVRLLCHNESNKTENRKRNERKKDHNDNHGEREQGLTTIVSGHGGGVGSVSFSSSMGSECSSRYARKNQNTQQRTYNDDDNDDGYYYYFESFSGSSSSGGCGEEEEGRNFGSGSDLSISPQRLGDDKGTHNNTNMRISSSRNSNRRKMRATKEKEGRATSSSAGGNNNKDRKRNGSNPTPLPSLPCSSDDDDSDSVITAANDAKSNKNNHIKQHINSHSGSQYDFDYLNNHQRIALQAPRAAGSSPSPRPSHSTIVFNYHNNSIATSNNTSGNDSDRLMISARSATRTKSSKQKQKKSTLFPLIFTSSRSATPAKSIRRGDGTRVNSNKDKNTSSNSLLFFPLLPPSGCRCCRYVDSEGDDHGDDDGDARKKKQQLPPPPLIRLPVDTSDTAGFSSGVSNSNSGASRTHATTAILPSAVAVVAGGPADGSDLREEEPATPKKQRVVRGSGEPTSAFPFPFLRSASKRFLSASAGTASFFASPFHSSSSPQPRGGQDLLPADHNNGSHSEKQQEHQGQQQQQQQRPVFQSPSASPFLSRLLTKIKGQRNNDSTSSNGTILPNDDHEEGEGEACDEGMNNVAEIEMDTASAAAAALTERKFQRLLGRFDSSNSNNSNTAAMCAEPFEYNDDDDDDENIFREDEGGDGGNRTTGRKSEQHRRISVPKLRGIRFIEAAAQEQQEHASNEEDGGYDGDSGDEDEAPFESTLRKFLSSYEYYKTPRTANRDNPLFSARLKPNAAAHLPSSSASASAATATAAATQAAVNVPAATQQSNNTRDETNSKSLGLGLVTKNPPSLSAIADDDDVAANDPTDYYTGSGGTNTPSDSMVLFLPPKDGNSAVAAAAVAETSMVSSSQNYKHQDEDPAGVAVESSSGGSSGSRDDRDGRGRGGYDYHRQQQQQNNETTATSGRMTAEF